MKKTIFRSVNTSYGYGSADLNYESVSGSRLVPDPSRSGYYLDTERIYGSKSFFYFFSRYQLKTKNQNIKFRVVDQDLSINKQKKKKNLEFYYFVTSF